MKYIIETRRLILKPWEKNDALELYEIAKNPNVGPHAGWKPHDNKEESERVIKEIFLPSLTWKIIYKENNKIIGNISLDPDKKRLDIGSKELGYWLDEAYWNKGIITEASNHVIDYYFRNTNFSILGITTSPENIKSQKVINKLGFLYEGHLRKAFLIYNGIERDILSYSITREEWEER